MKYGKLKITIIHTYINIIHSFSDQNLVRPSATDNRGLSHGMITLYGVCVLRILYGNKVWHWYTGTVGWAPVTESREYGNPIPSQNASLR